MSFGWVYAGLAAVMLMTALVRAVEGDRCGATTGLALTIIILMNWRINFLESERKARS